MKREAVFLDWNFILYFKFNSFIFSSLHFYIFSSFTSSPINCRMFLFIFHIQFNNKIYRNCQLCSSIIWGSFILFLHVAQIEFTWLLWCIEKVHERVFIIKKNSWKIKLSTIERDEERPRSESKFNTQLRGNDKPYRYSAPELLTTNFLFHKIRKMKWRIKNKSFKLQRMHKRWW